MAAWDDIFGPKQQRFFLSVLHTARRLRVQGEPRLAAVGNIPCSGSAMCMAPAKLVNACNPAHAAAQATHLAALINVQHAGFCQDGRPSSPRPWRPPARWRHCGVEERFFQPHKANSLATVPLTLALFSLAGGDVERRVTFAANLGGDIDTMAAMGGAIAGTFGGAA